MPLRYFLSLGRAVLSLNVWWWLLLAIGTVFGLGSVDKYPAIREYINFYFGMELMPENVWHGLAALLLVWLVGGLLHRETMKRLRAARIIFDRPNIERSVPLYGHVEKLVSIQLEEGIVVPERVRSSEIIDRLDIVKIGVRNNPYDLENGVDVRDAWITVALFDKSSNEKIDEFDYPRWMDNPKPGYDGNPRDHYPHEWNFRTLAANASRNTVDLFVKSLDDEYAYGFTGKSQRKTKWKDEDRRIPTGGFLVRVKLNGFALLPVVKWYHLENPGAGQGIEIQET